MNELKNILCRLPYMPEEFNECTMNEIKKIEENFETMVFSKLPESCTMRRVCLRNVFPISLDFAMKLDNETFSSDIFIKFADNNLQKISEQYSYSFPSLVSDLFALWGFFLCLSAFVFVEIFEYLIKTVHRCVRDKFSKEN